MDFWDDRLNDPLTTGIGRWWLNKVLTTPGLPPVKLNGWSMTMTLQCRWYIISQFTT